MIRRAVAAVLLAVPLVFSKNRAGADIIGGDWSVTAQTLRNGVQSNEVGFWQALLYSNDPCNLTSDGIFGSQTYAHTKSWQQAVLGYTGRSVDGVVGPRTWYDTQTATGPGGKRLYYNGGGSYGYYGGAAGDSALAWGGGSSIWGFYQPGSGNKYNATTARTMATQPSIC